MLQHAGLTWDNIKFSVVTEGEFAGRQNIEITGLLDKSNKLSVSNTTRRLETLKRDMICTCLEGDILCIVCRVKDFKGFVILNKKVCIVFNKIVEIIRYTHTLNNSF